MRKKKIVSVPSSMKSDVKRSRDPGAFDATSSQGSAVSGPGDEGPEAGSAAFSDEESHGLVSQPKASLSPIQWKALEHLMTGLSMSESAKAAGIGRRTLYRWMNEDVNFRAAHNAWQKDTVAAARSSVLALSEPALRVVAAALEKGDTNAAMTILKSLGLLAPPKPGSSDVESVKKEQEIERKRKENDLFAADMEAGMPG